MHGDVWVMSAHAYTKGPFASPQVEKPEDRISHDVAHISCISSSKIICPNNMSIIIMRKPVFGVSYQVRHKPACTATEDGWRLEISDLESRGIVLMM